MEDTTKYMAGGIAIGAILGLGIMGIALYAQFAPVVNFVDQIKTMRTA